MTLLLPAEQIPQGASANQKIPHRISSIGIDQDGKDAVLRIFPNGIPGQKFRFRSQVLIQIEPLKRKGEMVLSGIRPPVAVPFVSAVDVMNPDIRFAGGRIFRQTVSPGFINR